MSLIGRIDRRAQLRTKNEKAVNKDAAKLAPTHFPATVYEIDPFMSPGYGAAFTVATIVKEAGDRKWFHRNRVLDCGGVFSQSHLPIAVSRLCSEVAFPIIKK